MVAPRDALVINLGCIDDHYQELRLKSSAQLQSTGGAAAPASIPGPAATPFSLPEQQEGLTRGFSRVQSVAFRPGAGAVPPPGPPLRWTSSRKILEVLISQECNATTAGGRQAAHPAAPAAPGSARGGVRRKAPGPKRQLEERLDRLGLDMVVMAGDGNCQFRALSNELFGGQEHHAEVREHVIEHIKEHSEDFLPFLDEDFDAYLTAMSKSGTWGDELTLRAASDLYGAVIRCITSDEANWYISYCPQQPAVDRELFLAYISPIHYNTVRRRRSLLQLRQRVGSGFFALGSMLGSGLHRLASFNGRVLATQRSLDPAAQSEEAPKPPT